MTMFLAPYTAIADVDGSPLDAGFLYLGEYGKDPVGFPVEVFWDADFTAPAAQPIRTRNGYPVRNGSPAKVYLKTAQHSIAIKNRKGAFVLVDFYNKGWDASFIVDGSGKTQQEINDLTGAPYRVKVGGYNIGERVVLANGDIVKSTVAGNTVDPNSDMTGWGYANNSESTGYKNAQNPNAPAIIRSVQQELDSGMFDVTRMGAKGHATFDSTSAFLAAQEEAAYLGAKALYVPASSDEYNIESSILNLSTGSKGIGLIGAGLNLTKLCWYGGAGRLINGFSAWQYGFSMKGFTLKTPATNKSQIVNGSVGIHLERTQSPGIISDILVQGFDTNIDIGVHAQFLTWQNIQSRQGNILLNAYGQNADLNVFDNCSFYAPVKKGVLLSAPRIVMRDCWFGTTSGWSDPDAVDITIGFQQVRAEDIGKSTSTTDRQAGHHAQFGSLIRPRFENNLAGTAPYIEFKDIDERTGGAVLRPFTIDNPTMQNTGMNACIRVADNREGIRIIAPEKFNQIPYLVDDVTQADGSVQYISIVDDKSHNTYMGQSSYAKFNQSFYFNSTVVNKTTEMTAGSSATLTLDEVNKACKVSKAQASSTELVRVVRPTSVNTAKFFIQASKLSLGTVDVSIYSSGTSYKFRMRNIPVEKLKEGMSIEIPNSENTSLTLAIGTVANTSGEIIFEKVLMNA